MTNFVNSNTPEIKKEAVEYAFKKTLELDKYELTTSERVKKAIENFFNFYDNYLKNPATKI